jgi:hypothetical protein
MASDELAEIPEFESGCNICALDGTMLTLFEAQ